MPGIISELIERHINVAFLCGDTNGLKKFINDCQLEGIEFRKAGELVENITNTYTRLDQDIALIKKAVSIISGDVEIQFYSRRSDQSHYYDWFGVYSVDYKQLLRDKKINELGI
jgi:hypothetical protein